MVPAAHGDDIPGEGFAPSPLTHLKDRYYHEVAAMPKIIGGRGREGGWGINRCRGGGWKSTWENGVIFLKPISAHG
jgi:hypothetical protein